MPLNLKKPNKLVRGDKIAALTLSWGGPAIFPARYQLGKQRLKDVLGLETVEMPHTLASPDFLKNNPEKRADDLMKAFQDPSIKAIITTIGGNDLIEILPFIDYQIIRENPKMVIGFSDATVLHFICIKAGIASFYGTSIMCEISENIAIPTYTFQSLQKSLFNTEILGEITPSEVLSDEYLEWGEPDNHSKQRFWEKANEWQFLQGHGEVSGQLIGGCLETMNTLIDSDIWPDLDTWLDSILFIEISEDKPTPKMVEEILLKLVDKKIFNILKGILFGYPSGQVSKEDVQTYDQVILNTCKISRREDLPIISRMNFGHTIPTFVIPYGATATINCDTKKFSITSPHCADSACSPTDKNKEDHIKSSIINYKEKSPSSHHYHLNCLLNRRLALSKINEYSVTKIHRLFQPIEEKTVKENLVALLHAVSTQNESLSLLLLESLKLSSGVLHKHDEIIKTIKNMALIQRSPLTFLDTMSVILDKNDSDKITATSSFCKM